MLRRRATSLWILWTLPILVAAGVGFGVWFWLQPRPAGTITLEADSACCIAVSNDGKLIAYGDGESLKVSSIGSGQLLRELKENGDSIEFTEFAPVGNLVLCVNESGRIRIWDVTSGSARTLDRESAREPNLFVGRADQAQEVRNIRAAAFSPDGKELATGHYYRRYFGAGPGKVRIWDLRSGDLKRTIDSHEGEVLKLAFSPDGRFLAAAVHEQEIRVWNTETWALTDSFRKHGTVAHVALAFSPDGRYLAHGGGWGTGLQDIMFRDLIEKTNSSPLEGEHEKACVFSIHFSRDGETVAVDGFYTTLIGRRNCYVKLWNWNTGKSCGRVPAEDRLSGTVFSPDGKTLYVLDELRNVKVWEIGAISRCRN